LSTAGSIVAPSADIFKRAICPSPVVTETEGGGRVDAPGRAEGLRHLAPALVGHGDHRRLENVGVGGDGLLHLDGRDVLATRDDDVLLAIAELDVAVGCMTPMSPE
jgi:hypothetical protein